MPEQPGRESRAPETPVISISGAARPLLVVAGALITLQSSQSLDPVKLAFFAVALLALAGSVLHAWSTRDSILVLEARPWLITSVIIGAIVCLSFPVALANGTAVGTWIRDAAPYALVVAAPWLALDLGAAVSPRVATWAIVIAGSLVTISFTINWVQRRHMVDLPLDRLVLPSFTLAMAFFALAVARSIWGRRDRYTWAVAAAVVIGLLLATGTRTTLALTAIPVILLVDAVRVGGRGTFRSSFAPAVVPLLAVALLVLPGLLRSLPAPASEPPVATPTDTATAESSVPVGSGAPTSPVPTSAETPEPTLAETPVPTPTPEDAGRFGTLVGVVSGTDQSMHLRWEQTQAAWNIFVSSPLVGRGLGVPIPWIDYDGKLVAEFWSDTPIAVLAKFGVFGIAIWAALGWATMLTLRRMRRDRRPGSATRPALLGFATGLIVLSPFGPQLEDKGTGLALILLLGLAFAVIRTSKPDESGLPARA
jgi:hypothetical protein